MGELVWVFFFPLFESLIINMLQKTTSATDMQVYKQRNFQCMVYV